MTRLVGVRAVCDGCSAAAAVVFCVAHRNVLCPPCDRRLHEAHAHHQRVDLASAVTALPFCEYCDDAPATTYCESEGTTLCDRCDASVHAANVLSHCRTPISRTLRSRAVEFRGRARARQSARSAAPTSAPPPAPTPAPTTVARTTPASPRNVPVVPPRAPSTPRRRSAKLLAKRKHRREPHRSAHVALPRAAEDAAAANPAPAAPVATPRSASPPARPVPTEEYNAFLSTDMAATPDAKGGLPTAQSAFPTPAANASPALNEQLLMSGDAPFRPSQEREAYTSSNPVNALDEDLSNFIAYGSLDLSGDCATALEDINGSGKSASASLSGGSSRRKTPEFDIIPHGMAAVGANRLPGASSSVAAVAVAAAAAAAAGEYFLLNSVSSASGSSRERFTPPHNDISRAPDPAGVAAVATAAAESAAAAVDIQQAAQGARASKASNMAGEAVGSHGGRSRSNRSRRRGPEPVMGAGGGIGMMKDSYAIAALSKRQMDESAQKLDIQNAGNRIGKHGRGEPVLIRPSTEQGCIREGNSDLTVHMSDTVPDEVLRRGGDGLGDLEIPRDDFGVFDAIDLSQFDQNGTSALGFGMLDFRSRSVDSDDR